MAPRLTRVVVGVAALCAVCMCQSTEAPLPTNATTAVRTEAQTISDAGWKGISIAVVFVSSIVAGMLPLCSSTFRGNALLLAVVNTFACGIFLMMGIMHVLPEAINDVIDAYGEEVNNKYQIANAMVLVGYLFLLLLNRMLFTVDPHGGHGHSHGCAETEGKPAADTTSSQGSDQEMKSALGFVSTAATQAEGQSTSALNPLDTSTGPAECTEGHGAVEEAPEAHQHTPQATAVSAYLLAAALSVHGFSEGMALGLQRGQSAIIVIFVAIAAHKWAESLALGANLLKGKISHTQRYAFVLVFALSSPVGIGVGWAAETILPAKAAGYLMAISAGTFLFIGGNEVVSEEFYAGAKHPYPKFVSYLLGCLTIFLVTVLTDD